MIEYLFEVTYRAIRGWAKWTWTVTEVAESLDEAELKMLMGFKKNGYIVVSYRAYGFIKAVEEVSE